MICFPIKISLMTESWLCVRHLCRMTTQFGMILPEEVATVTEMEMAMVAVMATVTETVTAVRMIMGMAQ